MTGMVGALAALLDLGEGFAWAAVLVFLRTGGAMALLPAFGEQAVPARVKLVLTLAFTAVVAPAIDPQAAPQGAAPLLAEAAAGLLLGAGFRLLFLALQVAGTMAAQAVSLSQILGGAGAEPQPAIGHVLTVSGLALAASLGLHVRVAEAFLLSYDLLPPGRFPLAADAAAWGLAQVARMFALGFTLAAPFLIASVIYNAALGAINRAMPQLMVSFIGAPALTAGGLILLMLTVPGMLAVWLSVLHGFLDAPFSVPR
ncbi:flagellar biosynthetic protein FliR [Ruixingdingia sedimenti]|uniref:Flagellar biosynthetic protein FliR n=1 Tax=Ruixingdingia sedimenti TaxID=3073604 RepID=A0ABU1F774_9RHOB|nr:flagellar biosynthetic protein FliR [Xinfangfangia sp. LG-4]MDR5652717.1 flagellar biosynthetic protein FliR [Xinfangfangia sp. LG-4]